MTLRSLAQDLTEPRLKMINGRFGKVPALLTDLREAISHSTSGGDAGTEGLPLPLNTKAVELLHSIERMAGEDHANRYGERFTGKLEGIIKKIGEDENHPDEWQTWFERIYLQWCDEINEMVRPIKYRNFDGTPCPSCGQAVHGPERETCVYLDCYIPGTKELRHVTTWKAYCRGCPAEWEWKDIKKLLASIG